MPTFYFLSARQREGQEVNPYTLRLTTGGGAEQSGAQPIATTPHCYQMGSMEGLFTNSSDVTSCRSIQSFGPVAPPLPPSQAGPGA